VVGSDPVVILSGHEQMIYGGGLCPKMIQEEVGCTAIRSTFMDYLHRKSWSISYTHRDLTSVHGSSLLWLYNKVGVNVKNIGPFTLTIPPYTTFAVIQKLVKRNIFLKLVNIHLPSETVITRKTPTKTFDPLTHSRTREYKLERSIDRCNCP
jgi:hypothetical protein